MAAALHQSDNPDQPSPHPPGHHIACWQPLSSTLNKYTTQSGPVLLPLPPVKTSIASDALDFVFNANSLRLGQ